MKATFAILALLGIVAAAQASWFPFFKIVKVFNVARGKIHKDIEMLSKHLEFDLTSALKNIKESKDVFDGNDISGSLKNVAAKAKDDLKSAVSHVEDRLEGLATTVQETVLEIMDAAFDTSLSHEAQIKDAKAAPQEEPQKYRFIKRFNQATEEEQPQNFRYIKRFNQATAEEQPQDFRYIKRFNQAAAEEQPKDFRYIKRFNQATAEEQPQDFRYIKRFSQATAEEQPKDFRYIKRFNQATAEEQPQTFRYIKRFNQVKGE